MQIQLKLSTTATLRTEESGRCRKVAILEGFKQESRYGLSAKKVAAVERWPLANHPKITYLPTNETQSVVSPLTDYCLWKGTWCNDHKTGRKETTCNCPIFILILLNYV